MNASGAARARRASRGRRRLIAVLIVTALAGLLSACAVIPSTGPVISGSAVNTDPREGVFQFIPDGPQPNADAEAIVTGFLRAAQGFADDHRVARSFLTPDRRASWDPDAVVSIYPGESQLAFKQADAAKTAKTANAGTPTPTVTSSPNGSPNGSAGELADRPPTTKVTVKTPILARIDVDGRYKLAPPADSITQTFTLVRSGGQWRISALSNGILLSETDFEDIFRPFPVYFTDPQGQYLIPDQHWFAGTQDVAGSLELPTALVRVLLEGPPKWLKGAVVSGAPAGTKMVVAAVVVSDDVATVDLDKAVRTASTRQRQLLLSQLQATLQQLSNIGAVQITVGRAELDIPPGSGDSSATDPSQVDIQPVADPGVDGRPVVIDAKGRLARLDGRTLETVKDVGDLSDVKGANRPAVSKDSSAYAVLNAARSQLLLQLPGTKMVTLVKSADLTAPSFDPLGWVWTGSGAVGGTVYAARSDAPAVKVKAPWLKPDELVSLRISRDGTRALVAVRQHGQAHLFVSGVIRDAEGRPESLTDPIGLVPDLTSVTDAAWVDDGEVVVLGRRSSVPKVRPWLVQIGGTISATTPVPGAESIAAGNGESSVLATTSTGTQGRSGVLWYRVSSARWPAFPG